MTNAGADAWPLMIAGLILVVGGVVITAGLLPGMQEAGGALIGVGILCIVGAVAAVAM